MKPFRYFFVAILLVPILLSIHPSKDNRVAITISSTWAEDQLKGMTLEQKIGQFFMIAAYPQKGDKHIDEIQQLIKENGIGSVIWFQGTKDEYSKYAKKLQSETSIPLLYGLDAEWGSNMRLKDGDRFPYAYTIGAADDLKLSAEVAKMMADECVQLGIHFNFSPVADVNSNANNPVIGFRSFGDDAHKVAKQVEVFVKEFEQRGVFASIKHFPGHGDTDKDSHHELPVLHKSLKELESREWIPFKAGINAGTTAVMVGHLMVPELDSKNPSSLSKRVIKDYLRDNLGFNGIVISDALNMKAVSTKYPKGELAWKAFEAGCDLLVYSENIKDAIQLIKKKVESGALSIKEIDERCLKILKLKQKTFIDHHVQKSYTDGEKLWVKNQVFEKSTALVRNDNDLLPIGDASKKILHVAIGEFPMIFNEMLDRYAPFEHKTISFKQLEEQKYQFNAETYEKVIVTVHANSVRPGTNYGTSTALNSFFEKLNAKQRNALVIFGNPLVLSSMNEGTDVFESIIVAYENNGIVQDRVAQQIMGSIPFEGKLHMHISKMFSKGLGLKTKVNGRMKFSQPEEVGVNSEKLKQIDVIVERSIAEKSFPGCQIVAAVDGKIFFRKSYGSHQYNDQKVQNDDLYDLASISKVAGSTTALMKLQSEDKFSLDKRISDYLTNETIDYPLGRSTLRELLAHQAGLKPFIPFYKSTMNGQELNMAIYSSTAKPGYRQVAKDLYLSEKYEDSIRLRILKSELGVKKYLYSDLGYYFVKKIVEDQAKMDFDAFLVQEIYAKMGLQKMMFNPATKFSLDKIAPTEDDHLYRKQLIRGYVHDPGAAMIGGVAGHAGLFSNATELAYLMQMYLNKGYYGGMQLIDAKVVEEYTRNQFAGNRRGAGWDKPVLVKGGGTCDESCSQLSFGHSGFTGTLAWADPKNGLNYVFLSNRVYPDAENKKLITQGTRSQIQRILNEVLKK